MIATTAVDPITFDPDIARSRCHRAGIDHIGRLIADITVDCTTGCGEAERYAND